MYNYTKFTKEISAKRFDVDGTLSCPTLGLIPFNILNVFSLFCYSLISINFILHFSLFV